MSQVEQPPVPTAPPRRKRRLLWNAAGLLVALMAIGTALVLWLTSREFENLVRGRLVAQLQKATGGRVEIGSFHWRPINLEAEAGGVVIHGLENPGEAPYAAVDDVRVQISILGIFSPRILLHDLEVVKPKFHLIVYPDGSTNQPHPKTPRKMNQPVIDTVFDLEAGHVAVEQGSFYFDSRATGFDFAPRYLPLEFQADDVSMAMKYVPEEGKNPESYHIDAGASDLKLLRGGKAPSASAYPAHVQASIDLTRNAAYVRSLQVTEHTPGEKQRALEVSGTVSDLANLRWQGTVNGEFDLHLLNPIFGFPFTPEGVARMNLAATGDTQDFRVDGPVHVDDGSYVDPSIRARKLQIDGRVHVDATLMHFSNVVVRFPQGGQVDGDLQLEHWAPHPVRTGSMEAAPPEAKPAVPGKKHFWNRPKTPAAPAPKSREILVKGPKQEITVHGKITSKFENVALDTILDMVGQAPFNRLGVDTALNGPAIAEWMNGDVNTLKVDALLGLAPSGKPMAGEVAGTGAIDASYTQRTGVVDLRRLELNLPASQIEAQGRLGAFPLSSTTQMKIDFRTRNLGEFDTTLRDLGLERNGKAGSAALPVALTGQGEFHGTWGGSLISPRLEGSLKATELAIELPPNPNDQSHAPQFAHWDSIEANGSYDAERIAILKGRLNRGEEQISFDGTMSAANAGAGGANRGGEMPGFDSDSMLHAHVRAMKVSVNELFPLLGIQEPVTGTLEADFETEGRLGAPGGSGWVELDDGSAYGEPISRARAQGTYANETVKLNSITITNKAGSIAGSLTYDVHAGQFQADAHGAGLDIGNIEHLRRSGESLTGKLGFSVTASGTMDDPRVEARANLTGLAMDHESLGSVEFSAHTVNRDLVYDATSRTEAAELILHGQTSLRGDYQTEARIDFSRFDIGAVFRLAHVDAIKGESALSGTASIRGPLSRMEALQGDARLETMAMTVAGVHLQSEGGVHATLADGRVNLDPLHITGEDTDLRAQGSVGLKAPQRLDFAASGSINLKLAETIDSDLTAGGTTTFQVEAHGPLSNPGLRGRVDFNNGSLSLEDLPNGLSQLHGTLEFNQNRLEVRSLTAMTGGGQLSLGGYLTYQHGLFADLSVTGNSIRVRYPQGVSSLADATLHLQGTQSSLLLSGNVMLTRFAVSPDLDIAALAAQANGRIAGGAAGRAFESRAAGRAYPVVAAIEFSECLREAGGGRGPAIARHDGFAIAAGADFDHRGQRDDCRDALRTAARRRPVHQPGAHSAVDRSERHGAGAGLRHYAGPARDAGQNERDVSQRSAAARGGRDRAAGAGPHAERAGIVHAATGAVGGIGALYRRAAGRRTECDGEQPGAKAVRRRISEGGPELPGGAGRFDDARNCR